MKPQDMILVSGDQMYEVVGIFLGGEGQESVVEVRNIFRSPAVAYGQPVHVIMVPELLLRGALASGVAVLYSRSVV